MRRCSRRRWLLGLGLFTGPAAFAQKSEMNLEDLLRAGEAWFKNNIDEGIVHALGDVDYEHVRQVMTEIQRRLDGQYVVDLAQARTLAQVSIPVLRRHSQTRPYGEWLEAQMDYFEVADTLRLSFPADPPPPKKPSTSAPAPRKAPPIPTPQQERDAWQKHMARRPIPEKAKPYVSTLKPIFRTQGIPPEMVWLAEVESSFNPTARSPVGAVGLYQLMPATAEWLGLKLKPTDERVDPRKNGEAAARYLRYLYKKFKNWELTLAAYNAGEGRVQRLIDKHKTRHFDRLSPHMPAETQMYVPRFEATLMRREGMPIAKLPAARA
jgi:membrane-bound lytic murein transglycosylase D